MTDETVKELFDARPSALVERVLLEGVIPKYTAAFEQDEDAKFVKKFMPKVADEAVDMSKRDPLLWINAILAYLDLQYYKQCGIAMDQLEKLGAQPPQA